MAHLRETSRLMFNEILDNFKLSKNVEIAVFNWTVRKANVDCFPKSWAPSGPQTSNLESFMASARKMVHVVDEGIMKEQKFNHKYGVKSKPSKFRFCYTSKIRSLVYNLRHVEDFKQKVIAGIIDVKRIADLRHDEIKKEPWATIYDKMERLEAARLASNQEVTGLYTCHKCKSNKTKHVTVQTRAADEPETIYITCMECKCVRKE